MKNEINNRIESVLRSMVTIKDLNETNISHFYLITDILAEMKIDLEIIRLYVNSPGVIKKSVKEIV